jgi:hypothetical protein
VGDRAIDVGERAHARVDERIGLAEERVLEPVDYEPGNVAAHDHR